MHYNTKKERKIFIVFLPCNKAIPFINWEQALFFYNSSTNMHKNMRVFKKVNRNNSTLIAQRDV